MGRFPVSAYEGAFGVGLMAGGVGILFGFAWSLIVIGAFLVFAAAVGS